MGKPVLTEYISWPSSKRLVEESLSKNSGRLIVTGVLQRADVKNHNKRIYPKEILVREADRYMTEFVQQKRALGELDHPDSSVVNLANVSHNVLDMKWQGNALIGDVEILPTPAGRILFELFKSGITLGISSRGVGSVKEVFSEGSAATEVQEDFELIAFDFVSNPSTHGAFMQPETLSEGVYYDPINYNKVHNLINKIVCEIGCECKLK